MSEKTASINAKKCCLVVEDEDEVRERLAVFIENNGFKVLQSGQGYAAIDLYKEHKPAIVFLDVMLPDLDGLSVLKFMKEFDPRPKIYFFTGIDGDTFRAEAKKWGAAGHLVKPVQIKDILKILKEF